MFSQELLTNGELNHFSLKERMVEIGKRWHKLSQIQKDKYKKQVEEQQGIYKVLLEAWIQGLSPQDRAVYTQFTSTKRRSSTKARSPPPLRTCLTLTRRRVTRLTLMKTTRRQEAQTAKRKMRTKRRMTKIEAPRRNPATLSLTSSAPSASLDRTGCAGHASSADHHADQ
ncbi:hypothetical protein F7725_010753 [Dissostichus mawsoni]|uniref:HMG box domain-containing protein n=1 Tax=Dissostichus mawsoni TaxID=36200 RepID=A0A7J5Z6X2_DISMA|nr:hypothetical protein F7725_010753 [Dissostichus mawsoni]